jgi:hypothetical protein
MGFMFGENNMFRRKRKPVDRIAAKELQLYTENDYDIYRSRTQPIQKNLARKRYKGTYDSRKAVKGFQYATDDAARKYTKEFGTGGGFGIFTPIERKYAAARMTKSFEADFDAGNFSDFKQKYLRKKKRR